MGRFGYERPNECFCHRPRGRDSPLRPRGAESGRGLSSTAVEPAAAPFASEGLDSASGSCNRSSQSCIMLLGAPLGARAAGEDVEATESSIVDVSGGGRRVSAPPAPSASPASGVMFPHVVVVAFGSPSRIGSSHTRYSPHTCGVAFFAVRMRRPGARAWWWTEVVVG